MSRGRRTALFRTVATAFLFLSVMVLSGDRSASAEAMDYTGTLTIVLVNDNDVYSVPISGTAEVIGQVSDQSLQIVFASFAIAHSGTAMSWGHSGTAMS